MNKQLLSQKSHTEFKKCGFCSGPQKVNFLTGSILRGIIIMQFVFLSGRDVYVWHCLSKFYITLYFNYIIHERLKIYFIFTAESCENWHIKSIQNKSQHMGRKSTVCLYWQSTDEQLGAHPWPFFSHNASETTSTVTGKKNLPFQALP